MNSRLISKYNVSGPRYTSYPTVPYWDNKKFSLKKYNETLTTSFKETNSSEGISIYIHLPFCESLCTFCGCTKRITKNHSVEIPYLQSVIKEWEMYCDLLDERPVIQELHLGGGTPTFFSAENLNLLLDGIFRISTKAEDAELSFEGHPNNTTKEHLNLFSELGFKRVSYGVQDYNKKVQLSIHRLQPFENVKKVTEEAREAGFTSVGHDIIYGLPFQTKEDVIYTIERTKELMPDRIAFYSYAHVPWIKGNGQRGYKDEDLPTAEEKIAQYEMGKKMLLAAGYFEIGMDHFALITDSLNDAIEYNTLHRNFMGYTNSKTQVMIGLGVSAISDSWYGFAQNVKGVEEYQNLIKNNISPIYRGHILTNQDLVIRKHILNLMCNFKTTWFKQDDFFDELPQVMLALREMQSDGLVELDTNFLRITQKGKAFVRNVCMAFDLRLQKNKPEMKVFSMTV